MFGDQAIEMSNLTATEREGRKQIIRGIKESGWHLSQTDKSKKLVLDLKENYIQGLRKHTVKDTVVQLEDMVEFEIELYNHVAALVRVFGLGKQSEGETEKIIKAMKLTFCSVTPMSGEAKDHKTGWDPAVGPPKHPLCNGNIGANSSIGHIAFILLRPIRNDLARQVGTSV